MPNVPKFNTQYKYTRIPGILFDPDTNEKDVSLTEQSFAFECDINNIVKLQVPPRLNTQPPLFSTVFSPNLYEQAINVIAEAQSKFEELPSDLRSKFDNDPKKLLAFLDDESNYDKAVEYGLVAPKVENITTVVQPPQHVTGGITVPSEPVTNSISPNQVRTVST